MALDEPSDEDEVFNRDGFDVIIEKQLLGRVQGVKIEYESSKWMGSGFRISPTYNAGGCAC